MTGEIALIALLIWVSGKRNRSQEALASQGRMGVLDLVVHFHDLLKIVIATIFRAVALQ